MKNLFYVASLTVALLTISCNKDDAPQIPFPLPINEEEVITTVTTTLTNRIDINDVVILRSRDLDGDGPTAPVVTVSGNLTINKTYNGTVSLLNEIANPISNISTEVLAEGVDHQLFFQAPTSLGAFAYSDTDLNGKPIGLSFSLNTGTIASTGNLTVTLRHLPNKSSVGVASGGIANAGGATDAEVTYPVTIQ